MDFNFDEIAKVFGYLAPVLLFLVFNILSRKQQEQQKRVSLVKSILSEINFNQKLSESFSTMIQAKKFRTSAWERHKDKMEFLEDKGLYSILIDAYEIIKEFNREIDMARKYKSTSYLVGIKIDRLTEPLIKGKQGLQDWLDLNKDVKKVPAGT